MSTALRPGGLYYVNGVAVDANGEALTDAPPLGPNATPMAPVIASGKPLGQEIAEGIASALSAMQPAAVPVVESKSKPEK